jgi:hypothetical protein
MKMIRKTMMASLILMTVGMSTTAQADCYIYEFAELQTYSDKELGNITSEYENFVDGAYKKFGADTPAAAVPVIANCTIQFKRIRHILDLRSAKQGAPVLKK